MFKVNNSKLNSQVNEMYYPNVKQLHAHETFILYSHKNIKNRLCDWFVGKKLSVYFGEGKT